MKKKTFFNKLTSIYTVFGFLLLATALVLVLIPTFPYIWYRVNPKATEQEIVMLTEEVTEKETTDIVVLFKEEKQIEKDTRPPVNTNLPEGYFVNIPTINVLSPMSDNQDYEEALKSGTWLVPDYGTPEQRDLPIILAAHRFGYQYWGREERERISFYNLPKVNIGEKISIYWNQREYIYEVYKAEESNYISDYGADLILYTCKHFNSPVRIFRYARLIEQ
jgi:sortase (surface protein transpeptidase)